ncbi:deoxyribodipyrimidine photo-lyase [Brucella anthropi]
MKHHALVWLRNDLRINDNPALDAAAETGGHITAVYVHETVAEIRAPGGAARWWLDQSLEAIRKQLADRGIKLLIETGDPRDILPQLIAKLAVTELFWNRRYAPAERELDAKLKSQLKESGTGVTSFPGNLLLEPWELKTASDTPYQVFTPFAKALRLHNVPRPLSRRQWNVKPTQEAHYAPNVSCLGGKVRWALEYWRRRSARLPDTFSGEHAFDLYRGSRRSRHRRNFKTFTSFAVR